MRVIVQLFRGSRRFSGKDNSRRSSSRSRRSSHRYYLKFHF
jgi:hypothetical protein